MINNIIAIIYFCLIPASLLASDIKLNTHKLESFFSKMGVSHNTNKGGVYKDQAAGYYTGGSLYSRTNVVNTQLVDISMPKFSAGCGGIDLHKGAISFIRSGELVKTFKSIVSNAPMYGVGIALQEMTPIIYNTLSDVNKILQDATKFSVNSCEAASTLVGGVWPKTDASSKMLCSSMGTNLGSFSDWAAARQGCNDDKTKDNVVNKKKGSMYEDMLGEEFNLAWAAINKNRYLKDDQELAEYFMSISGSIISRKKKDSTDLQRLILISLATDEMISTIVHGGRKIKKYKCDSNDECLYPDIIDIEVSDDKALLTKIDNDLKGIITKLRSNATQPTDKEKAIIESTRIPILKIAAVMLAFKEGSENIELSEFSEIIAYDMLFYYLEQILDVVYASLSHLQQTQFDSSQIELLKKDIMSSKKMIMTKRVGLYNQINALMAAIERVRLFEKQLIHMFDSVTTSEE